MKVVVDSSGWIEFFFGLAKKDKFAEFVLGKEPPLISTIILFEVYRKMKQSLGEDEALLGATQMRKGKIIFLDENLSLMAADLSVKYKLPMADSIVYATAISEKALLVTSDNDFRNLPFVRIF